MNTDISIITVTGPMGSGKSKHIINIIEDTATRQIYVPKIDGTETDCIHSRDGRKVKAYGVYSIGDILNKLRADSIQEKIIIVDEVQFFNDYENVIKLVRYCIDNNNSIVFGGLDLDSECNLFLTTSMCMSLSTMVMKLQGTCECGRKTMLSKFIGEKKHCNKGSEDTSTKHNDTNTSTKTQQILVGQDLYKGTCIHCHSKAR